MAKFEGNVWAPQQMRYALNDKGFELQEPGAKVYAISRSTFYSAALCFEGIRFFCHRTGKNGLEITMVNWYKNLERFRRSISFNLGPHQQALIPSAKELEDLFINRYFKSPDIRPFLEKMADDGAQGYLRPFTLDEEQSMGVTFPGNPTIRAIFSRYDNYLGEPFSGVVIHRMVRAFAGNGTGTLKLGINYVMSLKAVEAAARIEPDAHGALFLDDQIHLPVEDRHITEWDSSCCLLALTDGSVVKIPEHELILPSVTIQGMTAVLRHLGVKVEERHMKYGELLDKVRNKELAAVASIGTAGIMNRCQKLVCTDGNDKPIAVHVPDQQHPMYRKLAEAKAHYWDIYKDKAEAPAEMKIYKYSI